MQSHDYNVGYNSKCIPRKSCTSSHDHGDARFTNISNKSGQSQGGSQMYHQAVLQDHGKVSNESLIEVNASNKSLSKGIEPIDLPHNHDADFGCISNSVPKCTPANFARKSDLILEYCI